MNFPVYTAKFTNVAVLAVQDLFEILVPSDAVIVPLELGIAQSSDAGDSEEEFLRTTLRRVTGSPTSGSGGGTDTPSKHHDGQAASGCTVEINNTTQLSGGTNTILRPITINTRIPETIIPIEFGRFAISPATRLVWELETAPADELTMDGWITYAEIGG